MAPGKEKTSANSSDSFLFHNYPPFTDKVLSSGSKQSKQKDASFLARFFARIKKYFSA
jgi:hypothetical protein